jgi:hypothetical protein
VSSLLGLGVFPTSSVCQLVRRHRLCPVWRRPVNHETDPLIFNNNKQSVFGTCNVVTAGSCLFVSRHTSSSGGGETGERRDLPMMPVDVIARHGERRADRRPKEESGRSGSKRAFHIAPPHNMSIARHGSAHMRLSGRQAVKTAALVVREPHPNMGSNHVPTQHCWQPWQKS